MPNLSKTWQELDRRLERLEQTQSCSLLEVYDRYLSTGNLSSFETSLDSATDEQLEELTQYLARSRLPDFR